MDSEQAPRPHIVHLPMPDHPALSTHAHAPDGTPLYVEAIGDPLAPPLLLIGGQATDHRMWDGIREDLAQAHRVIAYDHRGMGRSGRPLQPPYSTRGFAQDALAVLDHLGVARAQVYGFSMGGRVAQWLAIDAPGRVAALVLGATTPGDAHGARRSPAAEAAMSGRDPAARLPLFVSPAWLQQHPEFLAALGLDGSRPVPLQVLKLHYLASQGHDAWDRLPQITAPVLLLHGSADEVNPPANSALLAARIPGARVQLIEGARHLYLWEFREQASRAVLDFLAAHPI